MWQLARSLLPDVRTAPLIPTERVTRLYGIFLLHQSLDSCTRVGQDQLGLVHN